MAPKHENPTWFLGARYGLRYGPDVFKPPGFGGCKSCTCVERSMCNTEVPQNSTHEFLCLRHCIKGFVTQSHNGIRTAAQRTESAIKARALNRFAFGSEMLITQCSIENSTSDEGKYAFLKDEEIVAEDRSYRSTNVHCVYKVPKGYSPKGFQEDVVESQGLGQTYFPEPMELMPFPEANTVWPASRHLADTSAIQNNQLLLNATETATTAYNQTHLDKRKKDGGSATTAPSAVAGPSAAPVPSVTAAPPAVAPVAPTVAAVAPTVTNAMPAAATASSQGLVDEQLAGTSTPFASLSTAFDFPCTTEAAAETVDGPEATASVIARMEAYLRGDIDYDEYANDQGQVAPEANVLTSTAIASDQGQTAHGSTSSNQEQSATEIAPSDNTRPAQISQNGTAQFTSITAQDQLAIHMDFAEWQPVQEETSGQAEPIMLSVTAAPPAVVAAAPTVVAVVPTVAATRLLAAVQAAQE